MDGEVNYLIGASWAIEDCSSSLVFVIRAVQQSPVSADKDENVTLVPLVRPSYVAGTVGALTIVSFRLPTQWILRTWFKQMIPTSWNHLALVSFVVYRTPILRGLILYWSLKRVVTGSWNGS